MQDILEIKNVSTVEGMLLDFPARYERQDGVPVTIAEVTSVSVFIFDLNPQDGTSVRDAVFEDGPIVTSAVMSDTLLYDYNNMLGDAGGRNFLYSLPAEIYLLKGGKRYRVEIVLSMGSSEIVDRFNVLVGERFS